MSDSEVSGLYISDSRKELKKFRIDAVIPSNGFYVAAVSKGADSGFGISKDGETIFLSDEDGNMLDAVTVPKLSYNVTYSRAQDGQNRKGRAARTGCAHGRPGLHAPRGRR